MAHPAVDEPQVQDAQNRLGTSRTTTSSGSQIPDDLSPRHVRRRVAQVVGVLAVFAVVVLVGPGLGTLRTRIEHASAGWLAVGVPLEVLAVLSYMVIFRAVFCPRMSWRLSYQIATAEQAANSLVSASGVSGLALGAWALHRGGMSSEYIGRRTIAYFFLTSLANVGGVIIFAALSAIGVLSRDSDPALTYGFGAAALAATTLVLCLPALLGTRRPETTIQRTGRIAAAAWFARSSLSDGIRDAVSLLRHHPTGVLIGSVGATAFDLAVLAVSFRAFGYSPALGVLVLGYLIGQLGGNLPVPGGIGGLDGGLIAVFVLYHAPLAATTAGVLVYHAISLWVPALLGSTAFVQLRNTLRREPDAAAICMPIAEPIEIMRLPAAG